jgi:hypothetical protein
MRRKGMLTFLRIEGFLGPGGCDMKLPSREKREVGGCQRQAHNSCAFLHREKRRKL